MSTMIGGRKVTPITNKKGEVVRYADPRTGETVQENINIVQDNTGKIGTGRTKVTYGPTETTFERELQIKNAAGPGAVQQENPENFTQAIFDEKGKIVGGKEVAVTPEGNRFMPNYSTTMSLQAQASMVNDVPLAGGYVIPKSKEMSTQEGPIRTDIERQQRAQKIIDVQTQKEEIFGKLGIVAGKEENLVEELKAGARIPFEIAGGIATAGLVSQSITKGENPALIPRNPGEVALLGSSIAAPVTNVISGKPGSIVELGSNFIPLIGGGKRIGLKVGEEVKTMRSGDGGAIGTDLSSVFEIEGKKITVGTVILGEGESAVPKFSIRNFKGNEKVPTGSPNEIVNIPKGLSEASEVVVKKGKPTYEYELRNIPKEDEALRAKVLEQQFNSDRMLFDVKSFGPDRLIFTSETRTASETGIEGFGVNKIKIYSNVGNVEVKNLKSVPYYFQKTQERPVPKDLARLSVEAGQLKVRDRLGNEIIKNSEPSLDQVARAGSKNLIDEYYVIGEPGLDVNVAFKGFAEQGDVLVSGRKIDVKGTGFSVAASKEDVGFKNGGFQKEIVINDEPFQELYHANPGAFKLRLPGSDFETGAGFVGEVGYTPKSAIEGLQKLPAGSEFSYAKTTRFVEPEKDILNKVESQDFRENLLHPETDKSLEIYGTGGTKTLEGTKLNLKTKSLVVDLRADVGLNLSNGKTKSELNVKSLTKPSPTTKNEVQTKNKAGNREGTIPLPKVETSVQARNRVNEILGISNRNSTVAKYNLGTKAQPELRNVARPALDLNAKLSTNLNNKVSVKIGTRLGLKTFLKIPAKIIVPKTRKKAAARFDIFGTEKRRRGRARTGKGLPNVDLLNLAKSNKRFGRYSIPVGAKVEREYASRIENLGVFATFPTAETINANARRSRARKRKS